MIPGDGQYDQVEATEGATAYPSEADLVAKIVEAADAVLGVFEVVILDEPKAVNVLAPC